MSVTRAVQTLAQHSTAPPSLAQVRAGAESAREILGRNECVVVPGIVMSKTIAVEVNCEGATSKSTKRKGEEERPADSRKGQEAQQCLLDACCCACALLTIQAVSPAAWVRVSLCEGERSGQDLWSMRGGSTAAAEPPPQCTPEFRQFPFGP